MIYNIFKRFMDIILSFLLIILTFWLMLIISIITLIDSGFPIVDIRLPREGKSKKPFYMYKIRTRIYNKDNNSFTKFSLFLDKKGLNELPQLFNVLIGNMSFIGPRAFICDEQLPDGEISYKRYLVKPGIIGLAQSLGGRKLSYLKTLECDVIYYDNYGFIQDTKIFFKSSKQIFLRLIGK